MQPEALFTPEEYLAFEAETEDRHEYWIVEPDRPFVVRYVRTEGGILVHFIRDLDQTVTSEVLEVAIPMKTLYHRVAR